MAKESLVWVEEFASSLSELPHELVTVHLIRLLLDHPSFCEA
jgi:hypothetical protein